MFSFEGLIGQQRVKQQLIDAISNDRLPHASMIYAPEGTGGLPMAIALAKRLLCESPTETDACHQCAACKKVDKLIHPDLHFAYPTIVVPKKFDKPKSTDFLKEWRSAVAQNAYFNDKDWLKYLAETYIKDKKPKPGNITVNSCSEIIKSLALKAFEGKNKVQIIWMAEYLAGSGNTLLKLIEEPPADTYFILVVENTEQVLQTILSRTQIYKLAPLEDADVEAMLTQHGMASADAQKVAEVAEGSYNYALKIGKGEIQSNEAMLRTFLKVVATKNPAQRATAIQTWLATMTKMDREQTKLFFSYGLIYLRECMVLMVSGQCKLPADSLPMANYLVEGMQFEGMERFAEILNKSHYYIERNANAKIVLFNCALVVSRLMHKAALAKA